MLNYKNITGSVVFICFLVGSALILISWLKDRFNITSMYLKWTLLIILPIVSVYVVHSVLWWKGLQGSAGLLRVMATIVPLMALTALFAVNTILDYCTKKISWLTPKHIILSLIFLAIILVVNKNRKIEIDSKMIQSQKTLTDVAEWYKKNAGNRKIYYMPPYFAYIAGIDPYSENGSIENMRRFNNKEKPSENIKEGELILWETQFSIKEGKLLIENLWNDDKLVLIKSFHPENKIVFWGEKYEVHLFEKIKETTIQK